MGNAKAALAYLLSILGGIIVFFIAGEDKFAKFSAVQSILLSIVLWIVLLVVSVILGILGVFTAGLTLLLIPVLWLVLVIIVLYMTYTGWTGKKVSLPVIGGLAEKFSG